MAQSRLEKIGTIFTRTTGLLRAGAMRQEDKPIWYDVYEKFPPKLEPKYDRPAPNLALRSIFYKEDEIRANYHKSLKYAEMLNLNDTKRESQTQHFIKIYKGLEAQGALDKQQIFETAKELLAEQRNRTDLNAQVMDVESTEIETHMNSTLVADFTKAFKEKSTNAKSMPAKSLNKGIDIQNLFKD